MDFCDQRSAQRAVNGPVAGNTRLPEKRLSANRNVKMALATLLISSMSPMLFTFINNVQLRWMKHML